MKRLFYLFAVVLFTVGCNNDFESSTKPTPDPDLGEQFKIMEGWIDMSQSNKFNESLFCNDWILTKVTVETYIDGELTNTEDRTDFYSTEELSIKKDYTVTIKTDIGDHVSTLSGIWLYSHNAIMWKLNNGSYYSYEVADSKADVFCIKEESYPVGISIIPYFKDKSGKHKFIVYEYTAKGSK